MHLASCLPFEQAARMIADLLGVRVSAETARRLAEQTGAWMEVVQTQEREEEASRATPCRMLVLPHFDTPMKIGETHAQISAKKSKIG